MSVKDFVDRFLREPVPVEIWMNNGLIYVGSVVNWDAYKTHLKGFTNTEVESVSVDRGKLIVKAVLV